MNFKKSNEKYKKLNWKYKKLNYWILPPRGMHNQISEKWNWMNKQLKLDRKLNQKVKNLIEIRRIDSNALKVKLKSYKLELNWWKTLITLSFWILLLMGKHNHISDFLENFVAYIFLCRNVLKNYQRKFGGHLEVVWPSPREDPIWYKKSS